MSIIGNHISGAIEAVKGADGTSHEINAAYLDGKSSSTYAASSDLNNLKSTVNGRARVYVVDNLAPSSTDTTKAYINSKLTASPDAERTITWTDGRYVLNPGGGSSGGGSGGSIRSTSVQSASGDQRQYWYLATVSGDIRASNLKPGDMICFTRNTATDKGGVTAKKRPSIYFVKSITGKGASSGTTDYTMVLCRKPAREFQLPYNSAGEQPGYYPVNSVGYAARGGPSDDYGYGIVLNRPFQEGTDAGRGIAQIYIPDSPGSASDHQVMVRSLWGITDSNYADKYKTTGWTKIATGGLKTLSGVSLLGSGNITSLPKLSLTQAGLDLSKTSTGIDFSGSGFYVTNIESGSYSWSWDSTTVGSSYEMNVTFQNGTKGYGSWHVVATCSADPSASTGGYGSQIVVGVGNVTSSGFLLSARRWNNSYTPPTKWVIHWIAVKYY